MTKKRSKCLFVVFAIILAVLLIATFVSFTYPFSINGSHYRYSSFINNIRVGEDISSSLKIVYRADLPDGEDITSYDSLKESTIRDLKSILQDEGFKDTTATSYSNDSIVVTVGNLLSTDDVDRVNSLIGNPATISFKMDSEETPFATAKDVSSVSAYDYPNEDGSSTYYVLIMFSDAQKIESATKSGTLHIYFGDTEFTSMSLDQAISTGYIMFTSESFTTHEIANSYANRIRTGMLGLELTQLESNVTEGSYGSFTNRNGSIYLGNLSAILIWVALGILVLAGFVFLIVKYNQIGWVASFNLLFFVCIGLFLLQSMPLAHFNFAGMLGLILAFALSIDGIMEILQRAKRYYNADAKLYIAFKTAQKESLMKIFLQNALLVVAGVICVFMPNMAVQSFGWAMLVLPFVSLFTNLVLFRLFIKMYMAFNNADGKKCNFHKGGKND